MARQSATTNKLKYKIKLLKEGDYHPALPPLSYEKISVFFKRIHRKEIHKHTVRKYYLEFKDKEVPQNCLQSYAKSHDMKIINALSNLDNVFDLLMSTTLRQNIENIIEQAQKNPLEALVKDFKQSSALDVPFEKSKDDSALNDTDGTVNNGDVNSNEDEKTPSSTTPIQAPFARAKQSAKNQEKIATFNPDKYL